MLAAKYRFHGYGALKFLFGHGRTYRFKSMSIRTAKNPRREHSRVAVVISKKVLKAAPKRNQARRRIFEIIRESWPHIRSGHDILISMYDPHIIEMSPTDLQTEVHAALADARLLVPKK